MMRIHWNMKMAPAVQESMIKLEPGCYDIEGEITEVAVNEDNIRIEYEIFYVRET
jgi:hypothetical protein